MNEIKYFEVNGDKFPALFDLNVVAELQDEYGSISEWNAHCFPNGAEPRLKPLIHAFQLSINEGYDAIGSDKKITKSEVGRILTEMTLAKAAANMQQMVIDSTKNGSEEKNATSPTTESPQNSTLTG